MKENFIRNIIWFGLLITGVLGAIIRLVFKAFEWLSLFYETVIGRHLLEQYLSGFIITPLSIICDIVWLIVGIIVFGNSKISKAITGVISFAASFIITGLGLPDWLILIVAIVTLVAGIFIQKELSVNNDIISSVKKSD